MKFQFFFFLLLVLFFTSLNPFDAAAQPKQGDKTLNLYANDFYYSRNTIQRCDSVGNNCVDNYENKIWRFGLGMSGGYLLTDIIEAGIGVGVYKSKYRSESASSDYWYETPYFRFSGDIYGKLHLASESKIVPFIKTGGGLSYGTYEFKSLDSDPWEENVTSLFIFGEGGIDFYVGEMYAISCSVLLNYNRQTNDFRYRNFLGDYDEKISGFFIRFGLGASTYF